MQIAQGKIHSDLRARFLIASISIAVLLTTALSQSGAVASKRPANPQGKIYACAKSKGKGKGTLRLVQGGKRCKRGERMVAWNAAGAAGAPGTTGAQGSSGSQGPAGPANPTLEALVKTQGQQIEALTERLVSTETSLLSTKALLHSVCAQTASLTTQSNALLSSLGGLSLGGTIPPLLTLEVPLLPSPIVPLACP
jgi:predicted Rossmann fold nucleotide-binding protein DprA/Smf involved in DNA uptake